MANWYELQAALLTAAARDPAALTTFNTSDWTSGYLWPNREKQAHNFAQVCHSGGTWGVWPCCCRCGGCPLRAVHQSPSLHASCRRCCLRPWLCWNGSKGQEVARAALMALLQAIQLTWLISWHSCGLSTFSSALPQLAGFSIRFCFGVPCLSCLSSATGSDFFLSAQYPCCLVISTIAERVALDALGEADEALVMREAGWECCPPGNGIRL